MDWKRVSKSDLVGRFFVREPGVQGFLGYYSTVYRLLPLFKRPQFQQHVSGCYINEPGMKIQGIVRLSYFAPPESHGAAVQEIESFLQENKLDEIYKRTLPEEDHIARNYGGEEFESQFRKFLTLETLIGLEIMEADLKHALCLLTTFRLQVFIARLPIRPHFEPAFKRDSPMYRSLSSKEKSFFWSNLEKWPNPPQVDWAHFLVNLILGQDWNFFARSPREPFSIEEINDLFLNNREFKIPTDWKPEV